MERKEPETDPFDDLAARLQEALGKGLIKRNSSGYEVAKALIDGDWKDLSEKDRAVFNKDVKPLLEE